MITSLEQTLSSKFMQAKASFENGWQEGMFAWLQQNAIGHSVTLTLAETELDAAWIAARQDPAQMPRFDQALGRWKDACIAAVLEFKTRSGQ